MQEEPAAGTPASTPQKPALSLLLPVRRSTPPEILLKVLPGALLAAVAGLVWLALRLSGSPLASSGPFITAIGGSIFLAVILGFVLYSRFRSWHDRVWLRNFEATVTGPIGIQRVYRTLEDARDDIYADIRSAGNIRLFLQLGRYMLAGPHSLLYEAVASRASERARIAEPRSLRVLHASSTSPFLSQDRLRKRGSSSREIQSGIQHLRDQLLALRDDKGIHLERREHSEPYLWRLLFFDNVAYVSGYLFDRDNDKQAVVYKVVDGPLSLFRIFDRYFEYLWEKYPPTDATLEDLIPRSALSSSAVLVHRDGKNLFMTFDRPHEIDGHLVYRFAAIGGKRQPGEDFVECAKREAAEETSCRVTIVPARRSVYVDHSKLLHPISVRDTEVPIGIIETPDEATATRTGWGKRYTVIYLGTLEGDLRNRSEVRGFLAMTDDLLQRTYTSDVTFSQFVEGGGWYMGDKPPNDAILRPYGAAELLAIALTADPELAASIRATVAAARSARESA